MVVLNNISQRIFKVEIAHGLTWEEFEGALRLLKNHTAPGLNGVTSEEIKALDEDLKKELFQILQEYFYNKIDIPEWHWGNLRVLPKSGDLTSPHKWRGINLLDTASKMMSVIITKRLQVALLNEGYCFQFGSTPRTGCPDAHLLLKNILQLRREVDKSSWVVFLDLVKAFDTVDHTLILKLLQKIGIPPNVVRVI